MDNFLNILRNTLCMVCLIAFLSGCGKESEPQPKPKVVTKKITIVKQAVSHPVKHVKTAVKKPVNNKIKPGPAASKAEKKKIGKPVPGIKKSKSIEKYKPTGKKAGLPAASRISKEKLPALASTGIMNIEIPATTGFYSPEGKLDPFEPLFKEKAVVFAVKKKKLKRRTPLTPLERVDLSQLKLVGIIRAQSGNMAMVEEASGKGYIVKKGTYIGIHSGRIVQILRDRIIVEEKSEDIYGKVSITRKPLQLQKPPGE